MSIATFTMKSEQAKFPAGTVGGDWHWVLSDGEVIVKDWSTEAPFAEAEVVADTEYKISAQRMDPDKAPLGPVVSTSFSTDKDPEDVFIDVASSISVAIDGAPIDEGKPVIPSEPGIGQGGSQ
jgi:hypothetical protein